MASSTLAGKCLLKGCEFQLVLSFCFVCCQSFTCWGGTSGWLGQEPGTPCLILSLYSKNLNTSPLKWRASKWRCDGAEALMRRADEPLPIFRLIKFRTRKATSLTLLPTLIIFAKQEKWVFFGSSLFKPFAFVVWLCVCVLRTNILMLVVHLFITLGDVLNHQNIQNTLNWKQTMLCRLHHSFPEAWK